MRIFITGGGGLLGSKLAEVAIAEGNEVFSGHCHHVPEFGVGVKFDLENPAEISKAIIDVNPDVVFHTAALTDVDKCETDADLAHRINVRGTELVSEAARDVGSFLVYVSTDYVFDGKNGMYREDDETSPVNRYGRTKLLGEEFCDCVARTCVIYGARPASGKANFALWLIERLGQGGEVSIVTDQYVTPTLNTNLAEMLIEAGEKGLRGTFHMAGATRVSRYEFARELCDVFGFDEDLVVPSKMADMRWNAKRPSDSSLDTSKASMCLERGPLALKESLEALKEEML